MPRFIRTKYQQYKRDTLSLATWLATTALNYDFPFDSFSKSSYPLEDESERPSAQQLKNAKKKANKKAKERGEVIEEDGAQGNVDLESEVLTNGVSGDYLLTIPQFTEIARYLVEKNVKIPVELVQLTTHCITTRLQCLRRFLPSPDESTDKHLYFIEVLRDVRRIFQDHMLAAEISKDGDKAVRNLSNRFSVLAVKEGEENEEDLPDVVLPDPPRPPHSSKRTGRMVFAPQQSLEDAVWTVLAFFSDVHTVRLYLEDVWTEYKDGKIDLITASVTSNTAMELLRQPHEDIVKNVLPVFQNDIPLLLSLLLNLVEGRSGSDVRLSVPVYNRIDENDTRLTAAYDYLFIPLYQMLGGLSDIIGKDGVIPVYRAGHFGVYDPNFGNKEPSFRLRWLQSQILICGTFSEYLMLLVFGEETISQVTSKKLFDDEKDENLFYLDEMAVEMSKFAKTRKCSLLLLVYAQIFVDVNRILGDDTKRGVKEMRQELGSMKRTLGSRANVESPIRPSNWPENFDKACDIFTQEIEYWRLNDPIELCKRAQRGTLAVKESAKSSLLERDPILCGLLLFRFKLRYQHIGFILATASDSILATAQLYIACQHYKDVPQISAIRSWPDVDLILEMHGKEDLCGGKIPETVDDSYISFLNMMGYSKEFMAAAKIYGTDNDTPAWLKSQRTPPQMYSKTGPKGLKDHAQILPIFKRRYFGDLESDLQLDIKSIERLVLDVHTDGKKRARSGKPVKIRRERNHKSSKFSVIQLLSVLEAGLMVETNSIRFDYVSMHLRCIRILKAVKDTSHPYLSRKLGSGYLENDSQLPYVTGIILHFATMSGRAAEAVGIRKPGDKTVVASKLLVGANTAIKEYLKDPKEARAETDKIRR